MTRLEDGDMLQSGNQPVSMYREDSLGRTGLGG